MNHFKTIINNVMALEAMLFVALIFAMSLLGVKPDELCGLISRLWWVQ